jgi:diguanylate cyclase (GGDEF)-like protein
MFERARKMGVAQKTLFAMAFTALAALAMGTATQLPEFVAERLIETDLRAQAHVWERRVLRQIDDAPMFFKEGRTSEATQDALRRIPEATEIFRFSMFSDEGATIWASSDADLKLKIDPNLLRSALLSGDDIYERDLMSSGAVHHLNHDRSLSEANLGDGAKPIGQNNTRSSASTPSGTEMHHIVTITRPVTLEGRFAGAIRFCADITILRETLLNRLQLALTAVIAVALTLMLFVVWVVYKTGRSTVKNLHQRAENECTMMQEQIRLAREVRLLGELNEWLQSSRSLEELFTMVARFMTHILPDCAGSIYVYSNSRDVLDGSVSWNDGYHHDHIHPEDCWGLRRGRTYIHGYSEVDFTCSHTDPHDKQPYFCFPILAHGETVGLMHLRARVGLDIAFFRDGQRLAQMCAEQISMAIANVQMRDQLQDQSIRDPLTGLFNRRHMTETLRRMMGRMPKDRQGLSVVSVDIDHFKKFNDHHGHDAGDMVLRAVGAALEQHCDGDEIACRMGGEEFMLLLPRLPAEEALKRSEDLRAAVENITVRYGEKTLPRVTISVGIAVYPDHGLFPQDVMRVADDARYQAKANDRNQVILANLIEDRLTAAEAGLPSMAAQIRTGFAAQ